MNDFIDTIIIPVIVIVATIDLIILSAALAVCTVALVVQGLS